MLADESSIMLQRVHARNLHWPSAPRSFQSCRPSAHRKDRLRSPSKVRPTAPSSRGTTALRRPECRQGPARACPRSPIDASSLWTRELLRALEGGAADGQPVIINSAASHASPIPLCTCQVVDLPPVATKDLAANRPALPRCVACLHEYLPVLADEGTWRARPRQDSRPGAEHSLRWARSDSPVALPPDEDGVKQAACVSSRRRVASGHDEGRIHLGQGLLPRPSSRSGLGHQVRESDNRDRHSYIVPPIVPAAQRPMALIHFDSVCEPCVVGQ